MRNLLLILLTSASIVIFQAHTTTNSSLNNSPKEMLQPLEAALGNTENEALPNDFYYENNIYYDYNKINIRQEAVPTLDSLARVMNKYPDLNIEFEGHADSRGKTKYNHYLSLKRTQSAAEYLVRKGITRSRIKTVAKGKSSLANDCTQDIYCNETAHQYNRRTVIKLKR